MVRSFEPPSGDHTRIVESYAAEYTLRFQLLKFENVNKSTIWGFNLCCKLPANCLQTACKVQSCLLATHEANTTVTEIQAQNTKFPVADAAGSVCELRRGAWQPARPSQHLPEALCG
jgi:hypothetical protein